MRRKHLRWLWFIVASTTVVVALLVYRHHKRFRHVAVHEEGVVFRSAWLEPEALCEVIERYGIRTVVNLCKPGELGTQKWEEERIAVSHTGARLVELEMPNTVDPAHPLIQKHVEFLGDPDNYPLLVHCQHGITRTAKLLSIYDVAYRGKSGSESLSSQPVFGRQDHNVHVKTFVANFEKHHKSLFPAASPDRLRSLAN